MRQIGMRALTGIVAAVGALPGCGADMLDLPAPAVADLQAQIVAARYMRGGYSGVIDSTLDDPFVVYHWKYTQGVTLWALMLLHQQSDNPAYLAQVEASLASYDDHDRIRVDGDSEPIDYIGAMAHALLEYSVYADDQRYLAKALEAARFFHEDVARTREGLIAHHSDPDGGRIWADALFMVAPLMAKGGAFLDDDTYYADVLAQFRGFGDKLQDPEAGLFHQGWGWDGPGVSPGFWGRANGWVALAMTETLDTIPQAYPGRAALLTQYQDFAGAIVAHQGRWGMWHQLLDRPDSYEETSCTALFIYALATGIQRGWLPQPYRTAIDKAHIGLSRMISLSGNIDNISPGCSTKSSEQGYLDKGPRRNDSHGIGPVLLALHSLMQLQEERSE